MALELIKKLQLARFFQDTLASAHVKIAWAHLATVLVAARFWQPKMEACYGQADRIWIMDGGMSSPETLKLLGQGNRRYILGAPKSLLKKFEAELAKDDWEKVRNGLEVKRCSAAFGNEQEIFLLCRSTDRQAKDKK